MATLQERLETATTQVETDSGLLHDIIHGDVNTTVQTDGGPVKSVAKLFGDLEAQYEAIEYYTNLAQQAAAEANTAAAIDLNEATVSIDFEIPSGSNGLSVGPVAVAPGITVTISPGSTWAII